ncbi:TfoX/Sxy family protein [Paenibacillus sp. CF384]|uniref:TfoX/Sxy family protein n=1 Tax=Paenibacillus sp. CF384 TaxID=1884382 RepID=UPI000897EE33|nr:TfoX/Sxy family protein [Paenibacillus sp. CF384]SDX33308.1 TfoX N-terminal domain-containing protein [Paenibacillus sp. CF384]
MSQYEHIYNEIGDQLVLSDEVVKGSMFGAKCLKINKKAFAMFHRGNMVFKLPADNGAAALDGAGTFEPSPGKAMKGWIQVPPDHADQWEELSSTALRYVRSLSE